MDYGEDAIIKLTYKYSARIFNHSNSDSMRPTKQKLTKRISVNFWTEAEDNNKLWEGQEYNHGKYNTILQKMKEEEQLKNKDNYSLNKE